MFSSGYTALMLAAKRGYIKVVKFLVTKGASVEEKDDMGKKKTSTFDSTKKGTNNLFKTCKYAFYLSRYVP